MANKEVKILDVNDSLMGCLNLRVEVDGVIYGGYLIKE